APFARHNRAIMEQTKKLEAKLRRRDLLADATAFFAFFDARLPADVYSGKRFEEWRRRAEREHARLLFMTESDVLAAAPDAEEASPERHPDALVQGGAALPLEHRFEPGEPADGVTVVTPLEIMAALPS